MKHFFKRLPVKSKKQFELVDITSDVEACIVESGIMEGILVAFVPHTTASIRNNHHEPLLMQDVMKAVYRLVPTDISYAHDMFEMREEVAVNERTNGSGHVKAALFGSSESYIIHEGKLVLGPKQSVFLVEFDGGRNREVVIKLMGD
jgi:secondary thiamine-phosphate synthase enzyme